MLEGLTTLTDSTDQVKNQAAALELFASGAGVSVNAFTVVLQLMRAERVHPDGGLRDVPIANVNMSPQLAKALVALLAEIVVSYEAEFGPIPIPAEIQERITLAVGSSEGSSSEEA